MQTASRDRSQALDDVAADLQGWKLRGLHDFDPITVATIEAMLRRGVSQDDRARAVVEGKARLRLAASVARFEESMAPTDAASSRRPASLSELLAYIASRQSLVGPLPPAHSAAGPVRVELKALTYFQATWATLATDRRLRQSLSSLPENAGPLNSQRLVHRALAAMRELSPAYLERFIEHVDTLLWLDDAHGGLPLTGKAVIQVEADKPARKRPRRKAE